MKKIALIISAVFAISGHALAQSYASNRFDVSIATDFTYGDYERSEINMTSYDKDPSAHALVLKEYGKASISSNGNNTPLTFEYHVKIKIFDTAGFKKGHVELPFYILDNVSYEEIRTDIIKGVTYNDGMNETKLDPDSVHTVKINKHWSKIVFNMPNLHKGCVIEYRYVLSSPFLEKFRTWEFQSDIPKVYSEYEVHIPQVFGYDVSLRGKLKLNKDSVTIEKKCFESTNVTSDCTVEDYKMVNIPAFKEEPYINSPANYLSALHFQLTQSTQLNNYANLDQASQQNVATDWQDVDKRLKLNDDFGSQLKRQAVLKNRIMPLIAGITDTLNMAKTIFSYIKSDITFNGIYDIYCDGGIKKAINKHTGNTADINLALVAALNHAGIYANAVLISTRDNGDVNKLYPALTEFNDVIAVVSIGGKAYLLDATEPLIAFGILPFRDLNGQGRVIPMDKPSYWIDIKTPQKYTNTYSLDLTLEDNGNLKGVIIHNAIGYAAYDKRDEIKKFKNTNDYVKNLVKCIPGLSIAKYTINNLDSLDKPLSEVYRVEINNRQNMFTPFLFDKPGNNPFASPTRTYPVDFGMPYATGLTLTIHLPAGYTIKDAPKNLSATLPDNGGELAANFENENNTVTYTVMYHLDKPIYGTGEYIGLRDLFDKILLAERAPFNFKKKM